MAVAGYRPGAVVGLTTTSRSPRAAARAASQHKNTVLGASAGGRDRRKGIHGSGWRRGAVIASAVAETAPGRRLAPRGGTYSGAVRRRMLSRRGFREQILRTARCWPNATTAEIATAVGCSPATVARHLPAAARVTTRSTAAAAAAKAAVSSSAQIRRRAAESPACPAALLAVLAYDHSNPVRHAAGVNPNCPQRVMRRLATGDDYQKMTVAANRGCPPRLVRLLCGDKSQFAKIHAAEHCTAAPVLAMVASVTGWGIAAAVAQNRSAAPATLARLAAIEDEDVKENLANNVHCPKAVLRRFVMDPNPRVAAAALANPDCPAELLGTDTGDDSDWERSAGLAANPNTSAGLREETLVGLSRSDQHEARLAAAAHPLSPVQVHATCRSDPQPEVRAAAATNPNCPPEVVAALSTDPDPRVRCAVAGRRSNTPQQLAVFAADRHSTVRAAVAAHPRCPPRLRRRLSSDRAKRVRALATGDELAFKGELELECDHSDYEQGWIIRRSAAACAATALWMVQRLAGDTAEDVRAAAATNPRCPPWLLAQLAGDRHWKPAAAARLAAGARRTEQQ